jgi:hypothetical protein
MCKRWDTPGFVLPLPLFCISRPYTTGSMSVSPPCLAQHYMIMAGLWMLPERDDATRWSVWTAAPANEPV